MADTPCALRWATHKSNHHCLRNYEWPS